LKNLQLNPIQAQQEYYANAQRHSNNPNTGHAVGIVPVTDLSIYSKGNGAEQRLFVDKMSFEHQYNARAEDNYPLRGKRHGAYVVEQVEPKPVLGTKNRPLSLRGGSVWDLMHPSEEPTGPAPPKPTVHYKPPSGKAADQKNMRRDPIGYYDDEKFGGSMGTGLAATNNPAPNFNHQIMANTRENQYNPSWNGGHLQKQSSLDSAIDPYSANDLLDNAMKYQRPILLAADKY
jgi:hypothetical protein